MNIEEHAEINYQPDDEPSGGGGFEAAFVQAQQQLMDRQGVKGVGKSKTPEGQDTIVIYVADKDTLTKLPKIVGGFSVVGEITGDITAY